MNYLHIWTKQKTLMSSSPVSCWYYSNIHKHYLFEYCYRIQCNYSMDGVCFKWKGNMDEMRVLTLIVSVFFIYQFVCLALLLCSIFMTTNMQSVLFLIWAWLRYTLVTVYSYNIVLCADSLEINLLDHTKFT